MKKSQISWLSICFMKFAILIYLIYKSKAMYFFSFLNKVIIILTLEYFNTPIPCKLFVNRNHIFYFLWHMLDTSSLSVLKHIFALTYIISTLIKFSSYCLFLQPQIHSNNEKKMINGHVIKYQTRNHQDLMPLNIDSTNPNKKGMYIFP